MAVTLSVAVPLTSPDVAVTVNLPGAVAVQVPLLLQLAIVVLVDHVGVIEISLPSLSNPVAVNV